MSSSNNTSQPAGMKKPTLPQLVNTRQAAEILGRSAATLKRWRYEGTGPNWIELQGRVSYDVNVLLEYIQKNTRVASVRAAMEETREAV
ncbi:MAG TPA: DNA-binding protein [Candidatus Binatia bacterium]|nr:DNA-binding protein [Candidatus Binatia bacterium]